jgi:hypothetical protein
MSLAKRFPAVAALLASTGLPRSAAAAHGSDDQPASDNNPSASAPDEAALQAAFSRDADALISAAVAERDKVWSAVLTSPEGKANMAAACSLIKNSQLRADGIIEELKLIGPARNTEARDIKSERRADLNDKGDVNTGGPAPAGDDGGGDKGKSPLQAIRDKRAADAEKDLTKLGHVKANATAY